MARPRKNTKKLKK